MPLGKSYTVGVRLGLRAGAFSAGLKRSAGLTRQFGHVVQRTAGLSTRGLRGVSSEARRIGNVFQRTAGISRTLGAATRRMSDGMISAFGRTRRRVDSLIGRMRALKSTTAGAGSGMGRLLGAAGGAYGAVRLLTGEFTLQERYTRLGIQAGLSPEETDAARLALASTASTQGITNDQMLAGISAYVARGGLFDNAFNARAEIARAIVRSGADPTDIGNLLGDAAQQLGIVSPAAVERSSARLAAGEDKGSILLRDSAARMVPIMAGLATLGQQQEQALADGVLMLQTAGAAIGSPEKAGTAVETALGYLPDILEDLRAKGVDTDQTPIEVFRDVARNEEALKLFPLESKRFIRGLVSEAGQQLAERLQPLLDSPDLQDYLADTNRIRNEESVKFRRAVSDLKETFGRVAGPIAAPAVKFAADNPYAAAAAAVGAYGVYRGAKLGIGRLAGAAGLAAAAGGAGSGLGAPGVMGPIRRMTVTAGTVIVQGGVASGAKGRGGGARGGARGGAVGAAVRTAAGGVAAGGVASGVMGRGGRVLARTAGLVGRIPKAGLAGAGIAVLDVVPSLLSGDMRGAGRGAAGAAGGWGGWVGGAALGAALGSVVPIIGTTVGGIVGGILGSVGGYWVGTTGAGALLDAEYGDRPRRSVRGQTRQRELDARVAADADLVDDEGADYDRPRRPVRGQTRQRELDAHAAADADLVNDEGADYDRPRRPVRGQTRQRELDAHAAADADLVNDEGADYDRPRRPVRGQTRQRELDAHAAADADLVDDEGADYDRPRRSVRGLSRQRELSAREDGPQIEPAPVAGVVNHYQTDDHSRVEITVQAAADPQVTAERVADEVERRQMRSRHARNRRIRTTANEDPAPDPIY